jgi:hypothetical protein
MSDFAALDRAALTPEGPAAGSREARGSLALKALAVLNTAGVILAFFPPITPVASLLVLLFNTGAAFLAVVYAVVAVGLDRNRPWAIAVLRPILVLVAVVGVATLVVGFASGKIRIPFDVVIAGWALLAPSDVKPFPRLTWRSVGLAAATVPLFSLMLFAQPLGGWGGTLDVHQEDLQAALKVDCGAGTGGSGLDAFGLPPTISVSYDWSWNKAGLLPSGTDIVVIGWTGADADGHPLYGYSNSPDAGPGILAGLAGYPSTAMADRIGRETTSSFRWALPLDQQHLAPGQIDLTLRRTKAGSQGPKSLLVTATYIHEALWRGDAEHVTCTW